MTDLESVRYHLSTVSINDECEFCSWCVWGQTKCHLYIIKYKRSQPQSSFLSPSSSLGTFRYYDFFTQSINFPCAWCETVTSNCYQKTQQKKFFFSAAVFVVLFILFVHYCVNFAVYCYYTIFLCVIYSTFYCWTEN